jgi:hypothetical protein
VGISASRAALQAAGMVVHLSPGHSSGTLVNALLAHCGQPPCTVACGSDPAAAAAAGASAGQGLLSAGCGLVGAAAAGAAPQLGIIGGMLQDELGEGEDDDGCEEPGINSSSSSHRAAEAGSNSSSAGGGQAGWANSMDPNIRPSSSSSRGIIRPGIVHRLDRGTSGLMVVAKSDFCHAALCSQFKERSVSRIYNAIVTGLPSPAAARVATNITRDPGNRCGWGRGDRVPASCMNAAAAAWLGFECCIVRMPATVRVQGSQLLVCYFVAGVVSARRMSRTAVLLALLVVCRLRMMAVPWGSGRGRTAASNYQTLQALAGGGAALVQWKLESGRTHQIRWEAAAPHPHCCRLAVHYQPTMLQA